MVLMALSCFIIAFGAVNWVTSYLVIPEVSLGSSLFNCVSYYRVVRTLYSEYQLSDFQILYAFLFSS